MKTMRISSITTYIPGCNEPLVEYFLSNREIGSVSTGSGNVIRFETEFEAYKYARKLGYTRISGINEAKKKAFASVYNNWKENF